MSLPIPLAVRLTTARVAEGRAVTADVRDLTLRWTDPGGYQSCRLTLDRPLRLQPDEIAHYGTVTVYDTRNGMVVWDGRLEDPGRSAGQQGEVWDIAAVGGQAHTRDRTVPLVYIDNPLGALERVDNVTPGGNDSVGTDPGAISGLTQAVTLQFPQGLAVVTNDRIVVRYVALQRAGQKLARVEYAWDAGRTDSAFQVQCIARTDGSTASGEVARTDNWSTGGGGTLARQIATHWTAGRNTVEWRVNYSGVGGTVSNDDHWASLTGLQVQATRYTAAGSEQTTAAPYSAAYVLASEVVADLLGRLLTAYDGAGATITTTTHQIDQLSYPDGVQPARVLEDLLTLESGHTWRVWERGDDGYRFEFVPVPDSVRYEVDATDGYDSQGSADGVYNRVTVRWRDPSGRVNTTVRTATVTALDDAGLIRQGSIDLGTDVGSLRAAERAGDLWLAERAAAPNAGRLRIARPVVDLDTGRMVQPWELRPGLIRVRGINPNPDRLNATSRDGVTVFRIVASEYRASDGAAVLELDTTPASTAALLASTAIKAARYRR